MQLLRTAMVCAWFCGWAYGLFYVLYVADIEQIKTYGLVFSVIHLFIVMLKRPHYYIIDNKGLRDATKAEIKANAAN